MGRFAAAFLLSLVLAGSSRAGEPPVRVYWSELIERTISRAALDGSGVETIWANPNTRAAQIALDVAAGRLYCTGVDLGAILGMGLDGAGEEILVSGQITPVGIAIDPDAGILYWSDIGTPASFDGVLRGAALDGSAVFTLADSDINLVEGLAFDGIAGELYWTDTARQEISRIRADGSGREVVTTVTGGPLGIAVDPFLRVVYFTDLPQRKIKTVSMDGGPVEDLYQAEGTLVAPVGIALHRSAGHLYFTTNHGQVRRIGIDGTAVEPIRVGLENPFGIALSTPPDDPGSDDEAPVPALGAAGAAALAAALIGLSAFAVGKRRCVTRPS